MSVIGSLEHLAYLRTAPAARKEWADLGLSLKVVRLSTLKVRA